MVEQVVMGEDHPVQMMAPQVLSSSGRAVSWQVVNSMPPQVLPASSAAIPQTVASTSVAPMAVQEPVQTSA